jgi:hypothetical protein
MRKLLWLLWLFLLGICDAQLTPHMALNLASHDTAGWDVLLNNNFTALDTSLGGLVACSTNQGGGGNGTAWMCTAFPTGPPTVVATRSQLVSNGVSQNGVYQTKPVLDARDFSGANAGAQIQAAHDSSNCPSTGCVIDARGYSATDTIAGLSITKPVCLEFGATTFSVTATMTWTNVTGPCLIGAGASVTAGTAFDWTGNNSTAMFRFISVAKAVFRDFSMKASTTVPLTAFFTSERGAIGNPTDNAFYDITGDGVNGGVTNGFAWVIGAGGDNGNDNFKFTNVEFDNYTNAAWYNPSTQSQIHSFYSCSCVSNRYGKYCYDGTGSFSAYNMIEDGNTAADFNIAINNGVLISGGISIGSNRFYIDGSSSNSFTATIQGVNFAATGLNADGKVMVLGQRGPYFIVNNQVTASSSLPAQFYYGPSGLAANAIAIGNNILTNLSAPFTGGPWQLIGNSINTGPPAAVPDVFPNGLNGTAYLSVGTTFTSSAGCSETSLTGGATAGFFLAGATSCTTTVKMGHSATAPNGWACSVWDMTTTADVMKETASTTTTVTFSGTVAPSDKIIFGCIGF